MKFIRMLQQQLRKMLLTPYTYIAIIAVFVLFMLCIAYVDPNVGKNYTVMDVILHKTELGVADNFELSWQQIENVYASSFFLVFVPCIISYVSVSMIITEKKSGYIIYEKIRCKDKVYRTTMYIAGTFISGIICMCAYLLFFVVIRLNLPDAYSYTDDIENVKYLIGNVNVAITALRWLIYGMVMSAGYFVFVTIIREKNFCLSMGIFVTFLYNIFIPKLSENVANPEMIKKFRLNTITNSPVISCFIYVFCLVIYILFAGERRKKYVSNGNK